MFRNIASVLFPLALYFLVLEIFIGQAGAQSGNSSTVNGTVMDSSGAVVPGATVKVENPVSHFTRSATSDDAGKFSIPNVPLNNYHVTTTATGFATQAQDVELRSAVPATLKITLPVASSSEDITVEAAAGGLLENDSTFHTDVDRSLFDKVPLESLRRS